MKIFILISFLSFSLFSSGQDIIKTIFGDEIKSTIIEISDKGVKYHKFDEPYSNTIYTFSIENIEKIIYKDGTVKTADEIKLSTLNNEESKSKRKNQNKKEEKIADQFPTIIYTLAKKGSRVYITSYDNNAIIHAKMAIEPWGYWQIVDDQKDADFVLKFYLRFEGAGVCIANAAFVDPKTNNILYSTQEVTSIKEAKGFDFNTKRSAIRQVVEQVFKPNFK
ncbi:MAG: hypothetical protein AB7S50_00130 [Bacteroidales bacterium]